MKTPHYHLKSESKNVVTSFSYPSDMIEVFEAFENIIDKDKTIELGGGQIQAKNVSQAIINFMAWYVKVHSDNPLPKLTKYIENPEFVPLPSIGEILRPEKTDAMDTEALLEILKHARGRSEEVQAALKRKGISNWEIQDILGGRQKRSSASASR